MYGIMAVFAQLEREVISERTSEAMLRHQANGRRMSNLSPIGTRRDPDEPTRLVPDPAEQDAIHRIIALAATGMGCREIARTLDAAGILCRGHAWHHDIIGKVIRRNSGPVAQSGV